MSEPCEFRDYVVIQSWTEKVPDHKRNGKGCGEGGQKGDGEQLQGLGDNCKGALGRGSCLSCP